MKKIIILFLMFIAFKINAQTTYSSIEVINGQITGYALDITIYENIDGTVDYEVNRRTSTSDDLIASYILTGATVNESNGVISFQTDVNTFFIPFEMSDTPVPLNDIDIDVSCQCFPAGNSSNCNLFYRRTQNNALQTYCLGSCGGMNYICTEYLDGAPHWTSNITGIFINAKSVSRL